MKVFFVYIDWTTEEIPRSFYVGKGTIDRVNMRERNEHWCRIAAKYGWRREVVFATKDEAYAFEQEILGILELGTFEHSSTYRWGANKTTGGDGTSGYRHTDDVKEQMRQRFKDIPLSLDHREKLSAARLGKIPWNKGKRYELANPLTNRAPQTDKAKAKISASLSGKPKSVEHAAKVASKVRGRTDEEKARISAKITQALVGKKASEETKAKLREAWKRRKSES